MALTVAALDEIPRLGWVTEPTPVEPLRGSSGTIWVKRDDLLGALFAGTKPRKLDYLLARPEYRDAQRWHAVGAIGSGQLVAAVEAARICGRQLIAHTFWEPLGGEVLDNLAFIATHAHELSFAHSRLTLALRHPRVVLGVGSANEPVIAPGATDAVGMLGAVHLGLELAEQFRRGDAPTPARIYVPLGSGGIAVGLSVGLALGQAKTCVHAVAVVERIFSTRGRLRALRRAVLAELSRWGVVGGGEAAALPIGIDRSQLGHGYGARTQAAVAACEHFEGHGLVLEPVYSGKAAAALLADRGQESGPVMLLCTPHRGMPLVPGEWRAALPRALRRRLSDYPRLGPTRRTMLVGTAAVGVCAAAMVRGGCYASFNDWMGETLTRSEAHILTAWAEALLPPAPDAGAYRRVAQAVDRVVSRLPAAMRLEVHGMFMLLEHGTVMAAHLPRASDLSVPQRIEFFERITAMGGLLAQATRGMRDLVFMGYYQQPGSWPALAYEGPRVPLDAHPSGPGRMEWPVYDALLAPGGQSPRRWKQ